MINMEDEKNTTEGRDFVPTAPQPAYTPSIKSKEENLGRSDTLEDVELGHRATYIATGEAASLSQEHRDYLIARYGTLELNPIPDMGDQDPYNWRQSKKTINLVLVALAAMTATLTAAAVIPAYSDIAASLDITLNQASYLSSIQIAILGGAPFFWKPISTRYGRRPIWLISFTCACAANLGCAWSNTYAQMAACRAVGAFFISPAQAIGTGIVTETFFKSERGKYVGIWTLLVTLGIPIGPLCMGFVQYYTGSWRWIYWILAIWNGFQLIAAVFFMPETRYLRKGVPHEGSAFKQEYFQFRRIDPAPFTFREFMHPLTLAIYPSIMIPACAYAMEFVWANTACTVEIPNLMQTKWNLNAQELGLQFISVLVGTVIGEQLGGALSDWWMRRRSKQDDQKRPAPEYRLWLSYSGFALIIIGLVVFFVQLSQAGDHWNITPLIGIAFAAAGNQIVTTVLTTYAIDSLPEESTSVGVTINFVRQIWSFIGPFWLPDVFASAGIAASAGVGVAMIVGVSIIPIVLLHAKGESWRVKKQSNTPAAT